MRTRAVMVLVATWCVPVALSAQEPRLVGRLPDAARVIVDSVIDSAVSEGLPIEPIVDRALEGAAKGVAEDLIVTAVRHLLEELRVAKEAFGDAAPEEIYAGASALRAGATADVLRQLRSARVSQSLTVASAVLADLVAVGVPADTAIAAVLTLAGQVADAQYLAFRRNVERDIALGASPAAALGVRLGAELAQADGVAPSSAARPPRRRKP